MPLLNTLLRSDSPKLARPVKGLVGFVMQKSHLFQNVRIRRDGYLLPFHSGSNVALTYWIVPELVDPTEVFVRSLLRPGDVFVDVGANVGTISALAAGLVGETGRVVAIEPHPTTFAYLQRTISSNELKNVVCLERACGSAAGVTGLTNQRRKDDNNRVDAAGSGLSVRVTTLASVLRDLSLDSVSLLKIDVEGFEGAVLRGLADEASRVAALYVEVIEANTQRFGDSVSSITTMLQTLGFSCFRSAADATNLVALTRLDQLTAIGGGAWEPVAGNPPLGANRL